MDQPRHAYPIDKISNAATPSVHETPSPSRAERKSQKSKIRASNLEVVVACAAIDTDPAWSVALVLFEIKIQKHFLHPTGLRQDEPVSPLKAYQDLCLCREKDIDEMRLVAFGLPVGSYVVVPH